MRKIRFKKRTGTVHLRFDLYGAWDKDETRHPQEVMKSLGITYRYGVPQSLYDCWWFLDCQNVSRTLPTFIKEMKKFNPQRAVGYGLSQEMADTLKGGA